MAPSPLWDVVVIGGGPAGAATARRLAIEGCAVVVLERSHYARPRVGETLPPWVQSPLRALGVWDRFTALGSLPSWGTRSAWAFPEPDEHTHLMGHHGNGWHVDRCAFDRMLAEAAVDAGARLVRGWSAADCVPHGTGWRVRSTNGRWARARVVVDATGRRAGPGRALGAHREQFDRLVAVTGGWSDVDVSAEQYLLVESAPDGWWYTAPVPGGARVGVLLTDTDLCGRQGFTEPSKWHHCLLTATVTALRVGGRASGWPLRVHPAGSTRLVRHRDTRPWLAVGDSALAVDPLTGGGVVSALRMAHHAADTVLALLDSAVADPLFAYESARDDECTSYLIERARQYAGVRRFDTPFWTLRSSVRAS